LPAKAERSLVGFQPQGKAFCPSSALGSGTQQRLGDALCRIRLSRACIGHQKKRLPRPAPQVWQAPRWATATLCAHQNIVLRLEALLGKPWQGAHLSRCASYRRCLAALWLAETACTRHEDWPSPTLLTSGRWLAAPTGSQGTILLVGRAGPAPFVNEWAVAGRGNAFG
jgi:hypothetical protein